MAEIRSSRPSDELAVERVVTERLNERGEPVIQIMAKFLDRNPRTSEKHRMKLCLSSSG